VCLLVASKCVVDVPFCQQGGLSLKLVGRPHRVLSAPGVEAQFLLPLDLHHLGVVNDDLHGSIANTLDGKQDPLRNVKAVFLSGPIQLSHCESSPEATGAYRMITLPVLLQYQKIEKFG